MVCRLKWGEDGDHNGDACGSISELMGAVGLLYIILICLGLLFVALEKLQGLDPSPSQIQTPPGVFQTLLPFDGGH